ncbi:MAG: GNAT family N-acetyltransferase [Treponemataceae bacterium]|nr:GNAT family N-acetyltransferase [Treponemataceae bacterium]
MKTIRMWLRSGAITYEHAQKLAKPHLDAMNERSRKIAKKCGAKYRAISFSSFMR